MSITKPKLKSQKKIVGGAALVALSGIVPAPQPLMQNAMAGNATTMTISGTFAVGITIQSATNPDLGTIIATLATGTAKVAAGGALGGTGATIVGGASDGKLKITFAANKTVDVKVAGFGKLTAPPSGATLTKMYFSGVFAGTVTGGTGTATATAANLALTGIGANKVANVGAGVGWTGGVPAAGTFSKTVTVTITY